MELSGTDREQLARLAARTPFKHRRAMIASLVALVVLLLFSSVTLFLEVARQSRLAGLSSAIAFRRLGMGVMRTGNLGLIRAVADFQIATLLLMLAASWFFGFLYVDRLESLLSRLWRALGGR